jgi:hypothetical protein
MAPAGTEPKGGATVEVTFASDAELHQRGGRGIFDQDGIEMLAKVFKPEEIEALKSLEKDVLAWIRQDPKHAVAYLSDPLGCLVHLQLIKDAALLAKLRNLADMMKSQPKPEPLRSGARIRVQ